MVRPGRARACGNCRIVVNVVVAGLGPVRKEGSLCIVGKRGGVPCGVVGIEVPAEEVRRPFGRDARQWAQRHPPVRRCVNRRKRDRGAGLMVEAH